MAKVFKPLTAAEIIGIGAEKGIDPATKAVEPAGENEVKQQLDLHISRMGVDPELLGQMSERVQNLTTRDLEDLTRRVAGVEVQNDLVNSLTIEDIQGIEALFRDQRTQTLVGLASTLGDEGNLGEQKGVNVSCCCCTPCCTCAAADVSPFED